MTATALIVLADGFEEIEALTPIDLLRRAGISVIIAGLESLEVRGSHGIIVLADTLLTDHCSAIDALILPGGQPGTRNLRQSEPVIGLVQRSFEKGLLCAAICAAPMVFDKAGILAGRKFTCFPGVEKEIRTGNFFAQPVIHDGNIVTGRAAGAAIPFGLQIVASLLGKTEAEALAEKIVYEGR
jgi:4-methyl-5(b-hydroxyethyl)-thiazole monophosphate biosynthesis